MGPKRASRASRARAVEEAVEAPKRGRSRSSSVKGDEEMPPAATTKTAGKASKRGRSRSNSATAEEAVVVPMDTEDAPVPAPAATSASTRGCKQGSSGGAGTAPSSSTRSALTDVVFAQLYARACDVCRGDKVAAAEFSLEALHRALKDKGGVGSGLEAARNVCVAVGVALARAAERDATAAATLMAGGAGLGGAVVLALKTLLARCGVTASAAASTENEDDDDFKPSDFDRVQYFALGCSLLRGTAMPSDDQGSDWGCTHLIASLLRHLEGAASIGGSTVEAEEGACRLLLELMRQADSAHEACTAANAACLVPRLRLVLARRSASSASSLVSLCDGFAELCYPSSRTGVGENGSVCMSTSVLKALQLAAKATHPEDLKAVYLKPLGRLQVQGALRTALDCLPVAALTTLARSALGEALLPASVLDAHTGDKKQFLLTAVECVAVPPPSAREALAAMPLFPTHVELFSPPPTARSSPRLATSYASLQDLVTRNLALARLEAAHALREHVSGALLRALPRVDMRGGLVLGNKQPFVVPVHRFSIHDVSEPSVGSARPAHVHAVLELSKGHLDKHSSDAGSWRALREGDSLCFAAVTGTIDLLRERLSATAAGGNRREQAAPDGNLFSSTGGALACVRCATVVRIHKDEDFKGLKVRVALDTAQYQLDLHAGNISCYDSLNVVVRRPRRENSHRALLESARELMLSADQLSGEPTLPDWLHKTLLGQTADAGVSADELSTRTSHLTAQQRAAVARSLAPGLHLISGAPGTGKTEVVAQTIAELYHGAGSSESTDGTTTHRRQQRILVLAQSNTTLDALCSRVTQLGVSGAHLVRLGINSSGSRAKDNGGGHSSYDLSAQGRMNWCLQRRLYLLGLVSVLAQSLYVPGDVGGTCEVAHCFYSEHVRSRHERSILEASPSGADRASPFVAFAATPQFAAYCSAGGSATSASATTVDGIFTAVEGLFSELAQYRPLERLRTQSQRADFWLASRARIVVMTYTHAATMRAKLLALGFAFDSAVCEEAAQCTELEQLVALSCQTGANRLARVVLVGDMAQLPPVVGCSALRGDGGLDTTLLARLARLRLGSGGSGSGCATLTEQVRCRASIADVWASKYPGLTTVGVGAAVDCGNGGFLRTCQLVEVSDLQGAGQTALSSTNDGTHGYENKAEAEFVVATYMYMRLLGYPSSGIVILTAYAAQKALIESLAIQRCAHAPRVFGTPVVSTIDAYQSCECDYALVSLVRTNEPGYLRDARRLVAGLSRARLGCYVFSRAAMLRNCGPDVAPLLTALLKQQPDARLQLVVGEAHTTGRAASAAPTDASSVYAVEDVVGMSMVVQQMQGL